MSTYYGITTQLGAAEEATAHASGEAIRYTQIAVGDGGGKQITPSAAMQSLVGERYRADINDLYVDPANADIWWATLVIPANVGGFTIREAAIYTAKGIMYAVNSVADTVKPIEAEGSPKNITVRLPFKISLTVNVQLLINPATTTATREWVERTFLRIEDKYDKGEFYLLRHPTLRPGFKAAYGGILTAEEAQKYPIWDYLQTDEGKLLCCTEAEWQAMNNAVWHTLADGTPIGWNGVGGAPFYVQDLSAGTLRLPDIRGMHIEAAGFDALGVGAVRGDMIRDFIGSFASARITASAVDASGIISITGTTGEMRTASSGGYPMWGTNMHINARRNVPVGNVNAPRSWGALPCVYLGLPAA